MPKIFHVNWFRVDDQGQFLWPGFGDNVRVLDWVLRRCAGDEKIGVKSPIGILPKKGRIDGYYVTYMYSDDSLIRTRLFPADISGLTSFPDY